MENNRNYLDIQDAIIVAEESDYTSVKMFYWGFNNIAIHNT